MPGMDHTQGSGLLTVAPEHLPALVGLLLLPLGIWLFRQAMRTAAAAGFVPARRLADGIGAAPLLTRAVAMLLAATGVMHLYLVPGHLHGDAGTTLLFLINGVLFLVAGLACFVSRRWRPAAAILLIATILAYLLYLVARRESPDEVGVLTKLIELTALGLVMVPRRQPGRTGGRKLRWSAASASLLVMTLLSGTVVWGASLAPERPGHTTGTGQAHHAQIGTVEQAAADVPPTAEQVAAASRLVTRTRAGIARYENQALAIADGYRPSSTAPNAPTVHFMNQAYNHDGRILDPARPEALVYANTASGPRLLGAMFMMPRAGEPGPDVGGSLTHWHTHPNICFTPSKGIAGLLSPFGTCPAGSINVPTPPAMMHVWTVANPSGAFGELDPAYLKRLLRE